MRAVEKRLRERLRAAQAELEKVKEDRAKFREFVGTNLRDCIRIHGQGEYRPMDQWIERFAKVLQRTEWWYW